MANRKYFNVIDKDGNVVDTLVYPEGGSSYAGATRNINSGKENKVIYNKDSENELYEPMFNKSDIVSSYPPSISIDEKGKITVSAPKVVLDSEEFKTAVNTETLKQASLAYKLNKNYKFPYQEYDEKTGKTTETEITVPEYIEKLNASLQKIASNIRDADEIRSYISENFNSKAEGLTDSQIRMSVDYKNGFIPIPKLADSLKGFKGISKYVKNGYISVEDFKKFYDLDNVGREEIATLLANLDNALKYGTYNQDEYYDGEDGEEVFDRYNANEMARAYALRSYILENDPNQDWWQSVGYNIESLATNALYGADRVFFNIANVGQKVFTLGQGTEVQNYIESMDEAYGKFNETNKLANDATAVTTWLGQIGGSIAGSLMSGKLMKIELGRLGNLWGKVGSAFANKYGKTMESAMSAAGIEAGSAAASALSQETIVALAVQNGWQIAKGAEFVVRMMPFVTQVNLVKNLAMAFVNKHAVLDYATKFLMDTFHDALVFDSTTLFHALESSDQDTRDYWMGQLVDNGKWWIGTGGAKWLIKFSGKTTLGQWLNAHGAKYVNKFEAWAGTHWTNFKNRINGGSLEVKLQNKLNDAIANNKPKKADQLLKKLQQLEFDDQLRNARRDLGNTEIKTKSGFTLKLSDDTIANLNLRKNAVRALNISIDNYNRGIDYKRQEMLGMINDPYTGMRGLYINPGLGGSNAKVSNFYFTLAKMNDAAGLGRVGDSFLSQEVIDYLQGQKLYRRYAGLSSPEAQDAAKVAAENLKLYSERIPEDIRKFIDENKDIYAEFYGELNDYAISHRLLDKNRVEGYNNETWKNIGGYQPIVVLGDASKNGRVRIDTGGDVAAVIDQEMHSLTYEVKPDQHFVDPELTRQSRINRIAQAEINRTMLDNYAANTGAAFTQFISGDETEYARKIKEGRKYVEKAVNEATVNFVEDFPVNLAEASKLPRKANKVIKLARRENIIANMTYKDTTDALVEIGVIYDGTQNMTDGVTADNFQDWYDNTLNSSSRDYIDNALSDYGEVNYKNLYLAMKNGQRDFEYGLRRAYLVGSEEFAKSGMLNDAAKRYRKGRQAFADGVYVAKAKNSLATIAWKDTDGLVDDLYSTFESATDDYVTRLSGDAGIKSAANTMSRSSAANDLEVEHFLLKRLQANADEVHKSIDAQIDDMLKDSDLSYEDAMKIKKTAHELFDDYVASRVNDDALTIKDSGRKAIDAQEAYEQAREINDRIVKAEGETSTRYSSTGAIMYVDAAGRQAFATVDPAFASLYNRRIIIEGGEAGMLAKANAVMSKTFRYGTTSVNLASAGNQLFRDFGNAVLVGGAWRTIKQYADEMTDVFGERIVEQIKRFDPTGYEIKQLTALAEQMGVDIDKAAVSRELMRGAAMAPSSTERTLYKNLWKELKHDSNVKLDDMNNKCKEILKKYNPDELINGTRENYLRKRVYAANLSDGLKSGYSVRDARIVAEFTMNNATTNFGRQLYHLQSIAESTPYFRAAINGTKSFWRMWSLDPVGISGRITGGLILPTMFLVGASLGTEENKKIYKNIPEYQKENSLVFVINGEIMSIPMPQELSSVVAPFRQFVEYLNDSQENDFWELMSNDLLGFLPVDLKGFTTIDMNVMTGDPTILDRANRGLSRVFSQVAPVPLKTIYMMATGTDPYTGKSMYDPSYWYWDDDEKSLALMDRSQNKFASLLAQTGLLGGNATVWEKVLSGIFGTSGADVLDDLAELFTEGPVKALSTTGENMVERVTDPFSVPKYNLVDSQWNAAVRGLTAEKDAILSNPKVVELNQKLAQEKDPEKRKELLAERQNYTADFCKKVAQTARRLKEVYGGDFDRYKLGAVVQLLNFDTDAVWQSGTQESSSDANSLFYSGRDAAIQMMSQMGIEGSDDLSVFGYVAKDKDGNPVVKYNTPITILDLKNQQLGESTFHLANIKSIVSQNNLYDQHQAVSDQISKIYNKAKKTNADYQAIEAIQINWNAVVAKTLAQYINKYSAEAAINNKQVRDYLKTYIEVPASWETNNKGRRVYGKTLGDKGSLKDAYYSSWLKSMFNVNDPYKGQY